MKIASIRKLHYNAKSMFGGVKEGALVANDVRDVDRGEESDFIESGLLFLLCHLGQLDWLDGKNLIVYQLLNLMDSAETAWAEFLEEFEIFFW